MAPTALTSKINELKESRGEGDFIGEQTAKSYIDNFQSRFPKVKEFFGLDWEKLKKLPPESRVVMSLMGRERKFPRLPTAETGSQFGVTWPQQIEADMIKTAILRLDRIFQSEGMQAQIVMMVHDSLLIEAPEAEAGTVQDLEREVMTEAGS